jgi:hypothetical protein
MTVWADRDAVVLRWLHESPPYAEMLDIRLSGEPHPDLPRLSQLDVHLALATLADEELIHFSRTSWASGPSVLWTGLQVSGAGLQALGEWPIFDALSSPADLGRLLDALADEAPNDEEENNLRRAAEAARSKSSELLQSLAAGAFGALARSQLS